MFHLQKAYEQDISIRIEDEKLPLEGIARAPIDAPSACASNRCRSPIAADASISEPVAKLKSGAKLLPTIEYRPSGNAAPAWGSMHSTRSCSAATATATLCVTVSKYRISAAAASAKLGSVFERERMVSLANQSGRLFQHPATTSAGFGPCPLVALGSTVIHTSAVVMEVTGEGYTMGPKLFW
jgi:hypothetical protein